MRKALSVTAVACLTLVLAAPHVGAQEPDDPDGDLQVLAAGGQVAPKAVSPDKKPLGPNPFLALVPDPTALDFSGWERYMAARGELRADQRRAQLQVEAVAPSPIVVDEDELPGDARRQRRARPGAAGQRLRHQANQNNRARILGTLSPGGRSTPEAVPANPEDDGSIPLAGDTGIGDRARRHHDVRR